jgi:hypothetical protein
LLLSTRKFSELCFYLKVVKSPSSPDLYKTVARSFIPAGMFLVFFHRNIKPSEDYGPPNGPNMFTVEFIVNVPQCLLRFRVWFEKIIYSVPLQEITTTSSFDPFKDIRHI